MTWRWCWCTWWCWSWWRSCCSLPAFGVTRADVDAVKFTQVLRGYKTSEVDWVLERLGRELEALRSQLGAIHASSEDAEAESDASNPSRGETVVHYRSDPA